MLSRVLEFFCSSNLQKKRLHVVELGCGTGICGIMATKLGYRCTLTDRNSDLAALNINHLRTSSNMLDSDVEVYNLSWESSATAGTSLPVFEDDVPSISVNDLLSMRGCPDLIIGAEITCLRKQQPLLVNVIADLYESNPHALVLLSFDGLPGAPGCASAKEMIQRMTERGFRHMVVYVGTCDWTVEVAQQRDPDVASPTYTGKISKAYLRDLTSEYCDMKSPLMQTFLLHREVPQSSAGESGSNDSKCTAQSSHTQPAENYTKLSNDSSTHHIILFYRPSAVGVCSRCQEEYFCHPVLHPHQACVHHSNYFVCRFHPAETRCSINGLGDGLGYYGNGQEGYSATFWDCCGAEDSAAPGCCSGLHVPYS